MAGDRPVDRDVRPPRLGGPLARLGRYAVLGGHGKLGNPYAVDGSIEDSPLAGVLQVGDVLPEQAPVKVPNTAELPVPLYEPGGGDGAPGSSDGGGDGGGESSGDF